MKNKKSKNNNYTVEVGCGWWYYKAKNMTDAICKAIRRSKLGIDSNFEVLTIRAKKGIHKHGP